MPSRAYTSFLPFESARRFLHRVSCVNALSGLYLISTVWNPTFAAESIKCQCPLGLIPHFYEMFFLCFFCEERCVNALSGLYLISTVKLYENIHSTPHCVSMPSRAYTSFLRYPFKNLGFMRFPEPVFAGIYQNILTTAIFRAC